jgi:hypothetical protein
MPVVSVMRLRNYSLLTILNVIVGNAYLGISSCLPVIQGQFRRLRTQVRNVTLHKPTSRP